MDATGIVMCALYAHGRRVRELALDEINDALHEPGAFVWLGLYEPDEDVLKQVQAQFGLHDLAVEDARNAHQRPKVEAYGESLFLVLRTARWEEGETHYGETHVFLGDNYLVSVRHGASQTYRPAREACEKLPHLLRQGPGFALYALMDFVVDQYFPVIDALEDKLDELETEMLEAGDADLDVTGRIYALKRELMEFRRATAPLVDVCKGLAGIRAGLVPEAVRPYFRDVYDHVLRINDAVEGVREMLSTALLVNLALAASRQSDVTKKLAGWGAILAVPTMAFSIYGMNFDFMPELKLHWAYPTLMLAVGAICVALHSKLKRAGWL